MANVNRPGGLSPHEYLDGSPWNGKGRWYWVATNEGHNLAIGDPVTMSGTGDARGVPGVQLATAGTGNLVLGAITGSAGGIYGGPGAIPGALETTVLSSATRTADRYVFVADDPNILFEIQEGGAGTSLDQQALAGNFNLLLGTNNGYISGWTLDNASQGIGSTQQLQLMRAVQRIDNTLPVAGSAATYTKWLVRINYHQWNGGVVGI